MIGFGKYSRVLNVTRDGKDYIYIFGGVSKKQQYVNPEDLLITYQLGDCKGQRYVARYTGQPIFRMGAINYDNKYIVTLGGTVFKAREIVDEAKSIYVLPLSGDNKGKNVKKDDWYELSKKLNVKGKSEGKYFFSAVIIDGIIHLVSYGGKYYTMKIKNILDEIDIGVMENQSAGLIDLQPWTQQGKTATPTKSTTVKAMGPKEDE